MFTYKTLVTRINKNEEPIELQMNCCAAAGYTGRDQKSVKAHIAELKKLDVPTPYSTPAIYWISPSRLTNHPTLVVVGKQTSPEVEFFIASSLEGHLYVTVASDHTDRQLEAISVGKSKQICDKILGDTFWRVDEIADHWDKIQLSSRVIKDTQWIDYQSGSFSDILHYSELLEIISADGPAGDKPCLLSGTIPIIGGDPIFTNHCTITLTDPVLDREISKSYSIIDVPDRS